MNQQPPLAALRDSIASVFLGNSAAIDRLIVCLLARGHCLIEDVPGVGKTVLATALARSIDASFSRLQLTPDLLPADILGVSIYRRDPTSGGGGFEFTRGPIFANIVLADEINRATPRTQTALLEVMSDAAVTIDGITHPLAQPFMLVATQNPSDFEGTFLLPENQLDRFLMRVTLGYPSPTDEARILDQRPSNGVLHALKPAVTRDQVVALQAVTDAVKFERSLRDYIVALATATRSHPDLQLGLSPRAALALAQAARGTAVLAGRDYVIPEDITGNLLAVGAHRVIPRTTVGGSSIAAAERTLMQVLGSVKSPA
ncbi:MAG TPA: MoxR family ATPase [Phycisphaerales bacterium]|nr:MoxR family ATPase [Phycisphaerales bacterium]